MWTSGSISTIDCSTTIPRFVFHYTFIPWLQSELEIYRREANDTKPRFNRNKVLPHGRPVEIFTNPEDYATKDFKVRFFIVLHFLY